MRKRSLLLTALCLVLLLSACAAGDTAEREGVAVTDAFGKTCVLPESPRVVSCYASLADCWLLAGGELVGVTEDAVTYHGLDVGPDAGIVGTVKHIDLEKLVALEPDYVLLSADLTAHLSLRESLETMGIAHGYFKTDVFGDYRDIMARFCAVTGRDDLYEEHVLGPEREIADIMDRIPESDVTVLLMRAYSTGMKAKTDDNPAGQILKEFGLVNIAEGETAMLADLSLEHIVRSDPDFIFILTMGDEEGARQFLEDNAVNDPAWSGLAAVKNGRCFMLPRELFHYKPNERWGESYEYLAKLIWPDIFTGEN